MASSKQQLRLEELVDLIWGPAKAQEMFDGILRDALKQARDAGDTRPLNRILKSVPATKTRKAIAARIVSAMPLLLSAAGEIGWRKTAAETWPAVDRFSAFEDTKQVIEGDLIKIGPAYRNLGDFVDDVADT